MKEETGPYWVEVSLESEEMGDTVLEAMMECENMRLWAMQEMTKNWSVTEGSPTTSELAVHMTRYIQEHNVQLAQRYSLLSALNSAVTEFNRQVRVLGTDQGGLVHLVRFPTLEPNSVLEIVIQARFIWRKYMAEYGRISTVYGSIFLEGDWMVILEDQMRDMQVSAEVFPYLIYSATLRNDNGEWLLCFNAHSPTSKVGRERVRDRKAKEQWE